MGVWFILVDKLIFLMFKKVKYKVFYFWLKLYCLVLRVVNNSWLCIVLKVVNNIWFLVVGFKGL